MNNILVLGAGMVGSAIVKDLAKDNNVSVIDINEENLNKFSDLNSITTIKGDVSDNETIKNNCENPDLVINAVPGFMGFSTLQKIIECGKDVVDISFFDEDPFKLDEAAKKKNITAVVDCGVAPGLSNIILGYHNSQMKISSFECMVGGLPFKREWPYQYKAPFSPIDVIEEYTRPARIIENGKVVTKPALSDLELVNIDSAGTLESFNTDGLRTLIKTMNIPDMKEKTLRYPGHTEYMKVLRESGFFNKEKTDVNGIKISPLELTTELLFPMWKLEPDEKEFTVLKMIIKGGKNGEEIKIVYSMFDEYDSKSGISSMARTTGYTCTAVARLLIGKKFNRKGICPPEFIGETKDCLNFVTEELKKRGIIYNIS